MSQGSSSREIDEHFKPVFANIDDAVRITRLSKATLCRMRMYGVPDSPPWCRVGNRVLYPLDGLRNWAASRVAATMGVAR